jgi:hypothetical protein
MQNTDSSEISSSYGGAKAQTWALSSYVLRFLNHTQLDARQDSSGREISPSRRLTTYIFFWCGV